MTLLDRLQVHKGGLVRIKSQLYWYGGRGWDGVPGRLCLVLDVATPPPTAPPASTLSARSTYDARGATIATALLLVDGAPHWIWVTAEDIELLT